MYLENGRERLCGKQENELTILNGALLSLYQQKKDVTAWCLHCRLKNKEKKILLQKKLKRLSGGELGQVMWTLLSKIFEGHSSIHIPKTNLPVNKDSHT